jgi:hypothetical protein
MTGDRDPASFHWMLVLAMAADLMHKSPPSRSTTLITSRTFI